MMTELTTAEDLAEANRKLFDASPREILRWAVETYGRKLTMATAFGPEGCAILHMLAEIDPGVRVFNLDTGYQFAETLELRERIAERYGIEVEYVRSETSVPDYETANGGPIYRTDPDRCCRDRNAGPWRVMMPGSRRSGPTSRRTGRGLKSSAGTRSSSW
jgi:phosphoadenosine phosphosulfate reductase